MRRPDLGRLLRVVARAAVALTLAATTATAQSAAMGRGLDLEAAGKYREALAAYREALVGETTPAAILGLERVYAELGQSDSLLVLVELALRARPTDPTVRSVQLRTLVALDRDAETRVAFEQWVRAVPGDVAPFRDYARLLLQAGRTAAADTVLGRAQRSFRRSRDLALEVAQLRAALGMWTEASASWREAIDAMPYLEQAAVFSLHGAPLAARDSVAGALLAPPVALPVRRVLATLLLAWGRPREGWDALASLPTTDSTFAAWADFAERAEQSDAWPSAFAAWQRLSGARTEAGPAIRGASAALRANDPAAAVALVERAARLLPPAQAMRATTLLRVQALARLGRAAEAEQLAAAAAESLDADERSRLAGAIADAWIRAGDVARAQTALASAGAGEDSDAAGWLALYAGDLGRARVALRRTRSSSPDLVMALAVLARSRADSAPELGVAFSTLARGDSAGAAAGFARAARAMPDAAPLLLATAARLRAAVKDAAGAVALWQTIATDHAASAEAPEAELEWARALRRQGARDEAIARLEHLILTYPRSALVPQARREIEMARAG
jgi:tetratricopeptide (TPR) repeat protein